MSSRWPDLSLDAGQETDTTLPMWTQIVGKIRLVQTPWINHSWHVLLYSTIQGLTTGPMPYGQRVLQIDFNVVDHQLQISANDGQSKFVELQPRSVADFYQAVVDALSSKRIQTDAVGCEADFAPWSPTRGETGFDRP